jgi:hypothetical protein
VPLFVPIPPDPDVGVVGVVDGVGAGLSELEGSEESVGSPESLEPGSDVVGSDVLSGAVGVSVGESLVAEPVVPGSSVEVDVSVFPDDEVGSGAGSVGVDGAVLGEGESVDSVGAPESLDCVGSGWLESLPGAVVGVSLLSVVPGSVDPEAPGSDVEGSVADPASEVVAGSDAVPPSPLAVAASEAATAAAAAPPANELVAVPAMTVTESATTKTERSARRTIRTCVGSSPAPADVRVRDPIGTQAFRACF